MASNNEGTHGKTVYMGLTAPSLQGRTSHMSYKLKIRLEVTSTSPPLPSTRPPEVMVASESVAVL